MALGNETMSDAQFGFKADLSTVDAIFQFFNPW